MFTEDGHRYYVHPETGDTTWDKPAHLAWLAANSDEHGREYYHNTVTKVASCATSPETPNDRMT